MGGQEMRPGRPRRLRTCAGASVSVLGCELHEPLRRGSEDPVPMHECDSARTVGWGSTMTQPRAAAVSASGLGSGPAPAPAKMRGRSASRCAASTTTFAFAAEIFRASSSNLRVELPGGAATRGYEARSRNRNGLVARPTLESCRGADGVRVLVTHLSRSQMRPGAHNRGLSSRFAWFAACIDHVGLASPAPHTASPSASCLRRHFGVNLAGRVRIIFVSIGRGVKWPVAHRHPAPRPERCDSRGNGAV